MFFALHSHYGINSAFLFIERDGGRSMKSRIISNHFLLIFCFVLSIFVFFLPNISQAGQDGNVMVLTNSSSEYYDDFEHYIKPYLDNFGIPYTVFDIAGAPLPEYIGDFSVIIVAHKGIDESGALLNDDEQLLISNAVANGTGLINFDSVLTDQKNSPQYQFIQSVFNFIYKPASSANSVEIVQGMGTRRINCWDDNNQDPILETFTSVSQLNLHDGNWDEFDYSERPFPTIIAGHDEWENNGLSPIHFYINEISNGTYRIIANLYTGSHTRHYYGFSEAEALAESRFVDNVQGEGGSDQHEEYLLGTIEITDGSFNLWAGDADTLSGGDFLYGWAWIRIVPEDIADESLHYIAERHVTGDLITLNNPLNFQGIIPANSHHIVAIAEESPLIITTEYGSGKAVQFSSYHFMDLNVLGPVYGMDDLIWRSIVWAAHKPFVMQGMPPLLTFRVDDCSGPMWWAEEAAAYGLKPWIGTFLSNIDTEDTIAIKQLVDAGMATTSVHSYDANNFFYYDFSDEQIAAHFADATQWHVDNNIPISKFVAPHYYQTGTNALPLMKDWGMEFLAIHMQPGTSYGSPWLEIGPYRNYDSGGSSDILPVYYADFLPVANLPEVDNYFFNVVTEIRDNAGYEWYPSNNKSLSIDRGITQLKRAFDSMVLSTLFAHEQIIQRITPDNWTVILDEILKGIESYNPVFVTMDEGAQYVRAIKSSNIVSSDYDPLEDTLTTTFNGSTDIQTKFFIFYEHDSIILEKLINVPSFAGAEAITTNNVSLTPGMLKYIQIQPATGNVTVNCQLQFTAQGYDDFDDPIETDITWAVHNSGGSINQEGLFTAGAIAGTFADTIHAISGEVTATATVVVTPQILDHIVLTPTETSIIAGAQQQFSAQGYDADNNLMTVDFSWQVVNGGGTIDQTGLFTAGITGGIYNDTIVVTAGTVSATASVTILDNTVDHFTVVVNGDQVVGTPFQIIVEAKNESGNTVTAFTGSANISDTTGTVSPVTTGSFSNGIWTGNVTITTEDAAVAITIQSGSVSGTSNTFSVTAAPLVEVQINLWEDEHQTPVLESFTDPGLLNDHDGNWDEFDYISRPFPTILAGHNEAEDNDLPLMHFHAENIADGQYEVWANLYTGRYTRHYYGFSEAEALAESMFVDNVQGEGGSDQHEEYLLGTIEITDGSFNLWAGNADTLGGGDYFYGWAHIKLVPDDSVLPQLDHFEITSIGNQVVGVPFTISVSAVDIDGITVTNYNNFALLTDLTGTLAPASTGTFTNGTWSGSVTINQEIIGGTVTIEDGAFSGISNQFDVTPQILDHIVLTPTETSIIAGAQQQFSAQGYDADNNSMTVDFSWQVINGGGTIDQTGLFTAGITGGIYNDTIVATAGTVSATASVTILDNTVDHFTVAVNGDQVVGTPFQIIVEAKNESGNTVTAFTGSANISDTTGTVSPVTTGSFSNGIWTGNVTITTEDAAVAITIQSGSVSGTSNTFSVTAAPLVEVQINLWEDEHQTPVLESFTNPGLLNDHDGNWDEFDYTGRPFPSILAGHNEAEDNDLPLMHFHAENIANGQYEVWANLYTGRYTRHYYGFSEAEALAESRFVDNVQGEGGSDQHEEYLLGTIEITDGSFNLWAGDADILSGGDYFYGWAHIRLVPDE